MPQYFSTFIVGLNQVVKSQLANDLLNFREIESFDGLIIYETDSPIEKIKSLKYLNNSFLLIKKYTDLQGEPITAMAKIALTQSLPVVKLPGKSFRIMFSVANKPTAIDKQLLGDLEKRIALRYKLEINRTNPDQEFLFLYRNEGFGFLGRRLTKHPDYKTTLAKGQLRPELANLLCLISDPKQEDIVLDPFAGSAAIPLERINFPHREIVAGDIEPRQTTIKKMDALDLKDYEDEYFNKIITDPPWGIYSEGNLDLPSFYLKMLSEFVRVLQKDGILVILVGNKETFENELKSFSQLKIIQKFDILVSGKRATIFRIVKN